MLNQLPGSSAEPEDFLPCSDEELYAILDRMEPVMEGIKPGTDRSVFVNLLKAIATNADLVFYVWEVIEDEPDEFSVTIHNDDEFVGILFDGQLIDLGRAGKDVQDVARAILDLTPVAAERKSLEEVRDLLLSSLVFLLVVFMRRVKVDGIKPEELHEIITSADEYVPVSDDGYLSVFFYSFAPGRFLDMMFKQERMPPYSPLLMTLMLATVIFSPELE